MKLEINREKTKVINLREEKSSLDFLGFTFRFDSDLRGQKKKYLNVFPSKKTMEREKEKLRLMTNNSFCFMPLPMLILEVNRHLNGWKNYFNFGYPRKEFRKLNSFVRMRLTKHTQRRSQRPFQPPKGKSYYEHFKNLNLVYL
jgi:RNA-directed DNA polymerase